MVWWYSIIIIILGCNNVSFINITYPLLNDKKCPGMFVRFKTDFVLDQHAEVVLHVDLEDDVKRNVEHRYYNTNYTCLKDIDGKGGNCSIAEYLFKRMYILTFYLRTNNGTDVVHKYKKRIYMEGKSRISLTCRCIDDYNIASKAVVKKIIVYRQPTGSYFTYRVKLFLSVFFCYTVFFNYKNRGK